MTLRSPSTLQATGAARVVVAGCMFAAPALLLVSNVIMPARRRDIAGQLTVLANDRPRWLVTHLLEFGFSPLMAVVIMGFVGLARPERVRLALVGGLLALTGLAGFTGHVALDIAEYSMTDPGRDRAQMVQLLDALLNHSPAFATYSLVPFLLLAPGIVLLAAATSGTRSVRPWAALCLALGSVLFVIDWVLASAMVAIIGTTLLAVGAWSVGYAVGHAVSTEA